MKKSLLIALCCITVLFAACKKEKPYEKFVGDYQGTVIVNGKMEVQQFPQANHEIVNQEQPISITLTPGAKDNLVVLSYRPEGQTETYTTVGTITNDFVDFEPIVVDQDIEQSHLTATFDVDGTLSGNQLLFRGEIDGNGSLNATELPMALEYKVFGTFVGPLTKTVAQ